LWQLSNPYILNFAASPSVDVFSSDSNCSRVYFNFCQHRKIQLGKEIFLQ